MNKKGFTLVEILIVIVIIGVLSSLAISGYISYRKTALLNLSMDNIVSQFNEFRSKAFYGTFGAADEEGNIKPKCYGVYFDGAKLKSFEAEFLNRKKWETDKFVYEGCADFATVSEFNDMDFDEQVSIVEAKLKKSTDDSEIVLNDFVLTFSPPDGKIKISGDGDILLIKVRYGAVEDSAYERQIQYDLNSGSAEVSNVNNED